MKPSLAQPVKESMPFSLEAERSLLGAVLLDNQCLDQALAKLNAGDFYFDSHQKVFSRMAELSDAGHPIDYTTLPHQLKAHGELEAVGGHEYIFDLAKGLPRVKNIAVYVNLVKDKSSKRKLIHVCNSTIEQCQEDSDPAMHIASMHDEDLMELVGHSRGDAAHVADFSDEVVNQIFNLRANGEALPGFSYGIEDLDSRTGGIRIKEFTIIGGRPKDGKTSALLQAIEANCKQGIPVGLFSVEMNREAILERLYASVGKINYERIRNPRLLEEDDMTRLLSAKQVVDSWQLYIDDDAEINANEICARARLMKKRHGVKLIGVDYIQIINGTGDIRQRMIKISRSLRTLAKREELAVIALSQLARPGDKSPSKRPEIWDLKESGSLEADANTILLIYRPKLDGKYTGEDEIIIVQRGGESGVVFVTYLGRWVRFENRSMRGY